jgi:streptogramin lyase
LPLPGNIYVADVDAGGYVDIYDAPVDAAASPSTTISNNSIGASGLVYPYGIALGPNGDLYASDYEDINQFTPPFTSSSVPSASVTPNDDNYGVRVDSSGRIFVANASGDGIVNVYTEPLTNASTPTFNLSVSSTHILGLAFDGSGNLWAVDGNGAVWEVAAPITSSSTATQVLTGTNAYGITFGP